MTPRVDSIDHIVLTVADIGATVAFYTRVLGMTSEDFRPADGSKRTALKFGKQKINLHPQGGEFDPKATAPTPGSADLCLITEHPIEQWKAHLSQIGILIEQGPVQRTGAIGPILSIYIRDPDGNLIEISTPL